MSFSDRLRLIAKVDHGSQVELAVKLELSTVAVNNYASGKRKPSYEVLLKLNSLGYSIDWLLSGNGSMKRQFFNDSEADGYDNEVLEAIYEDIGKKEFGLTFEDLYDTCEVDVSENEDGEIRYKEIVKKIPYGDLVKSKSIQRLIYREYSVKALKSKIEYSNIFKSLKSVISEGSYKDFIYPLLKDSGKLVGLLTNPEANNDNNLTSLKLDFDYSEGFEKYAEQPITKKELYQRLSNALYLIKELAEYESYLKDSIETSEEGRINNYNSNVKEFQIYKQTYSISFESLKSYFKTQIDLVGNTDLISRKSKILTLAVMNNFKFID